MIGFVAAGGAVVLGVIGLRAVRAHREPHTAIGSGVNEFGTSVAEKAGHAAGSVGRWASEKTEQTVSKTGSLVATGAGSVVDTVASPFSGHHVEAPEVEAKPKPKPRPRRAAK